MTSIEQVPADDHIDHIESTDSTGPTGTHDTGRERTSGVPRRVMLRGMTLGGLSLPLLAACGSSGADGGSDSSSGSAASSSSDASSAGGGSSSAAPSGVAGGVTVAAAQVPVGGGAILAAEKLVVTQPTKGDFKAFSAICTHQGCPVRSVKDGEIDCPCHGSKFSIKDGSPTVGPATTALAAKKVTVAGSNLTIT